MSKGSFMGQVKTRWLKHKGDDRKMKLLENFAYVDPKGVKWVAPKGSVVDGASIPQIFWSVPVGSPFVGDYRRASVLHDVACDRKTKPHKQVHRMFYDAMICDGVDQVKAMTMFMAVRMFGPKWGVPKPRAKAVRTFSAAPAGISIDQLEKTMDKLLSE